MQETFNDIVRILNQMIRSCKDASALCQTWFFNGHKRYYQCAALYYTECLLWFRKKAFDMYRMMPDNDGSAEPYAPTSFKEHFAQWERLLSSNIDRLIALNRQLFNDAGLENCTMRDVIFHLYKDRERTYRKLNQYNRNGWNPIELHATDRELHVKMKRKMRKRGIR